jgi:23S rRNA pseudouridine2605 synthase
MRIQQFLAHTGNWSRRAADELVAQGRVTVNGEPAQVGMQVSDDALIAVDGVPCQRRDVVVYAVHKPRGYVCSTVQQGPSPIVVELVPTDPPVYPVGRLDKESEGLIILTNDGTLAAALLHPSHGHKKTYHVMVSAEEQNAVRAQDFSREFTKGIAVDARPLYGSVTVLETQGNYRALVELTITEGRYHIIRRAFGVLGWSISRLIRVRIGEYDLGNLSVGRYRIVSQEQIAQLLHATR